MKDFDVVTGPAPARLQPPRETAQTARLPPVAPAAPAPTDARPPLSPNGQP